MRWSTARRCSWSSRSSTPSTAPWTARLKPLVYARARLPYLLLVDREAPFASASMVISGRYHEYARAAGADELELEEPFRLRLPLRA